MSRILPLLREFRLLERKRVGEGVTPSEYKRWLDVRDKLEASFEQDDAPTGSERRKHARVPTRMLVQFSSERQLRNATIENVSRGGLFVNTPLSSRHRNRDCSLLGGAVVWTARRGAGDRRVTQRQWRFLDSRARDGASLRFVVPRTA